MKAMQFGTFWQLSLLVLPLCAVAQSYQSPFDAHRVRAKKQTGFQAPVLTNFVPLGSLSAIPEENFGPDQFTHFNHPMFPRHAARIKRTKFCDDSVRAFTGYIDIDAARHIFFYFFESRNNPAKDDVIFWTNGGPGCSSATGLFMELGPCRILDANGTTYHPESWTNNANVFFIDQPVHVGFSYAEHGIKVDNTKDAAEDVAAFVAIFFENFKEFRGRKFHMSGESYAGRYLPIFASAVYDQNAELVEAGLTPINLQSVMIGNGFTDPYKLILSLYDIQCTSVSVPPIMDIVSCVTMKTLKPRCEKWMRKSCRDHFDAVDCRAATSYCEAAYYEPFIDTGMNPYDISKKCNGSISTTLCYPETQFGEDYLNSPSVRELLGVDEYFEGKPFEGCSERVGYDFSQTDDLYAPDSAFYVSALLERGVRVLIYAGTYDFICNWLSNEQWTLDLEWIGKEEFVEQELKDWTVNGKVAGRWRGGKELTFVTVEGAGHMVPYDKPKEALQMLKLWLSEEEFH